MSHVHHSLEDLFAQLGLNSDLESIEDFISQHRPLPTRWRFTEQPYGVQRNAPFSRKRLLVMGNGQLQLMS